MIKAETKHVPHVVYRCFNEQGDLLYVGVTSNPDVRFAAHRKRKHWWGEVARIDFTGYANRVKALQAERRAIQGELPIYNSVHTEAHGIRASAWLRQAESQAALHRIEQERRHQADQVRALREAGQPIPRLPAQRRKESWAERFKLDAIPWIQKISADLRCQGSTRHRSDTTQCKMRARWRFEHLPGSSEVTSDYCIHHLRSLFLHSVAEMERWKDWDRGDASRVGQIVGGVRK